MHVSRERNTPNADRSKLEDNQTLIHHADRHLPLSEVVHNKIHSVPQQRKIRTDAVYAVEILLTASPEYFRPDDPSKYGDYQSDRLADWTAATIKWLKQEYGDKIVRAELHLDEATPHIHAYLVPTDENGQLNCKKIFGGRAKMFAFQDNYAAAMKPLGLERGIRDSQAEHTTVKDYYTVVNAASQELDPSDLQAVQARAVAYARMQREHQELQRRLKFVAQQRDELAQKLAMTQQSVTVQTQINHALTVTEPLISIGQIACELRLPLGHIKEGIEAIDLVINTCQTDLVGATQWLNQKFGAAATIGLVNDRVRQIVTEQIPDRFIPPRPERDKWGEVKDYLTSTKQLPTKLVERLHEEGLIYANAGGKLICLHRDFEDRVTGATAIDLRGEQLQSILVEGSRLTVGFYYFEHNKLVDAERAIVCDDPIEAMAYATLNLPEQPTLYLSTHQGGWVSGDKFSGIEVVVATKIQLKNLPNRFEQHLPNGASWVADLKSDLDGVTSGRIKIGERNDAQVQAIEKVRQESLESDLQKITPPNPPQNRGIGRK